MAKESGLGMTIAVDDSAGSAQNIENDVLSCNFSTPRGVLDITGVDSTAMERLLALADFQCTLNGAFNDAAGQAHAVFKNVGTTTVARSVTIVHSGQTLGAEECVASDYALTRGQDGSLNWTAPLMLQDGSLAGWS